MRRVAALLTAALVVLTGCAPEAWGRDVAVTGDVLVHDPGLLLDEEGKPWVVASTGDERVGLGAIQIRVSDDGGSTWTHTGEAWTPATEPEWVRGKVQGVTNFWAPELVRRDGTTYLYYAASTFASNTSVIGLMTNDDFDPLRPSEGWQDRGEVVASTGDDNFNAIDPSVLTDDEGRGWLAFGSFWGGLQLVPLDWETGKPADGAVPVTIASRGTSTNAIEAPALLHHGDFYYLFASFDSCCKGTGSTYNLNVGRSESPEGPYLDKAGNDLAAGGGTLLLESVGERIGPGGGSVAGDWTAFHYYDGAEGGAPTLALREIAWRDGWPVIATAEEAEEMPFYVE